MLTQHFLTYEVSCDMESFHDGLKISSAHLITCFIERRLILCGFTCLGVGFNNHTKWGGYFSCTSKQVWRSVAFYKFPPLRNVVSLVHCFDFSNLVVKIKFFCWIWSKNNENIYLLDLLRQNIINIYCYIIWWPPKRLGIFVNLWSLSTWKCTSSQGSAEIV